MAANLRKKLACGALFAGLVLVSGGPAVAQNAVTISYLEGSMPVAPDAVTVLGPDMFGDRVNLFNGALAFEQTDLQLPGNFKLPVALTRSYSPGRSDLVLGQFGRWDLEAPRIGGTFPGRYGWVTSSGGSNRCTGYSLPPVVAASGTVIENAAPGVLAEAGGTLRAAPGGEQVVIAAAASVVGFNASDYWQGTQLTVPGHGSQEVLKRSLDYPAAPQDGATYLLLTRNNWQISCLPTIQNAAGEGFMAVSPDGVRYRFDWMATRGQAGVKKGGTSIGRADYFLMATEVTDRFGNWVRYHYDPANPYLLLKSGPATAASSP